MTSLDEEQFPVLPSVDFVVSLSRRVFLHHDRIESAVDSWGHLAGGDANWSHPFHFFDGTEQSVRWIFVLDVLNHCFWPAPGEPAWAVEYEGSLCSGYWGLAASLKRAMHRGIPITDAAYLSQIPEEDLARIFEGAGRIPLFEQRLSNLREAGRALCTHWKGDVVHLVDAAAGSAIRMIRHVVDGFPSFRDEALYHGKRVCFWKRAQLFASDLHAAFSGRGWGAFGDIGKITAFADYKLPQVLREFGIISYAPELAGKVDRMEYLAAGGEEEVEIRAAAVRAVESLKVEFLRRGIDLTSACVDNWLWSLGRMDEFRKRPYHRCRTIFYLMSDNYNSLLATIKNPA